jgi:acyl carrier protein
MASHDAKDSPISFEEFQDLVAGELQINKDLVRKEASFTYDLQADSIQLVEMMLRMEELGIKIPLETAWEIETVGQAYQHYRDHLESKGSGD